MKFTWLWNALLHVVYSPTVTVFKWRRVTAIVGLLFGLVVGILARQAVLAATGFWLALFVIGGVLDTVDEPVSAHFLELWVFGVFVGMPLAILVAKFLGY